MSRFPPGPTGQSAVDLIQDITNPALSEEEFMDDISAVITTVGDNQDRIDAMRTIILTGAVTGNVAVTGFDAAGTTFTVDTSFGSATTSDIAAQNISTTGNISAAMMLSGGSLLVSGMSTFTGAVTYGSMSGTTLQGNTITGNTISAPTIEATTGLEVGGIADVGTLKIDDWEISQVGDDLVFSRSGTDYFRMSGTGAFTARDDVTAFDSTP